MMSYGTILFYTSTNSQILEVVKFDDISYLKNCGSLCYIYSTMISQLGFNLFSKIPSATISSIIVESLRTMSINYGRIILKYTNTLDGYMSNFFALMLLTTLTFSSASFFLAYIDFGKYIHCIPKSIINGCFGTVGLVQFPVGWDCLVPETYSKKYFFLVCLGIGVAAFLFILQLKWPMVDFLIPLYSCILLSLSYLVFFSKIFASSYCNRFDLIREMNFLPKCESILYPSYIFRHFYFEKIKWQCIIYNIPKLLSIVFFNMILTALYLPGYRYATNIEFNYSRELATQGFTNIFTCIPSYFLPSYSITIHKIGGNHKIYGVVSALALILNCFFGLVLKGYVPTFLLSMMPFLLCFTFLHSSFYVNLKEASPCEYILSVIICFISYYTRELSYGILFGTFFYFSIFVYYYSYIGKRPLMDILRYMKERNEPILLPNHLKPEEIYEILEQNDEYDPKESTLDHKNVSVASKDYLHKNKTFRNNSKNTILPDVMRSDLNVLAETETLEFRNENYESEINNNWNCQGRPHGEMVFNNKITKPTDTKEVWPKEFNHQKNLSQGRTKDDYYYETGNYQRKEFFTANKSNSDQILNDDKPPGLIQIATQVDGANHVLTEEQVFISTNIDKNLQSSSIPYTSHVPNRSDDPNHHISILFVDYPFCSLTTQKTFHLSHVTIIDLSNCHIIDWQGTDELLRLKPQFVIGLPLNLRMARIQKIPWFKDRKEFINRTTVS